MRRQPSLGILGGLISTVEAGRRRGHSEIGLLDDLLHVAAGMAWRLGLSPERVAARLAMVMAELGRIDGKGGSGGN